MNRAPVEFASLVAESRQHRVLYMQRGAVVAVTTLLSIGGAFLWHAVLIGGVGLAWVFSPVKAPNNKPPELPGLIGTIVLPDEETTVAGGDSPLAAALGQAVPLGMPPMPAMPVLPDVTFSPPVMPIPEAQPIPAAMPVEEPGSVKVQPPPRVIAPPANTDVASIDTGGTPGIDRSDPDHSGEPMFEGMKGDGYGQGDGHGLGSGLGPPGGDRMEPLVIYDPYPVPPAWLAFNPPKKVPTFKVMVLANGEVGEIVVEESSGRPEVDAYYQSLLSTWKYQPATRGGKPIAASKSITLNPTMGT